MRSAITLGYFAVTALFFLYTAWSSATAPAHFAARLGLSLTGPGGVNEIRSQYAGFFLAAALLCVLAILSIVPGTSALTALLVIFGGLALGRVASLILNGGLDGFGPVIAALQVIDIAGFAAAALLLLWQLLWQRP
jgi:hypothetical protein